MAEIIDAAELRRRWTDKTSAVFSPRDRVSTHEFKPSTFERDFDFQGCESIVFLNGQRTGSPTDVIMLAQGTGHISLPPNVRVLVQGGYVRSSSSSADNIMDGSTVVGGSGARAPPPSQVSRSMSYARSSAGSGYNMNNGSGSRVGGGPVSAYGGGQGGYSSRRSSADSYRSRSGSGGSGSGEWQVVEQAEGYNFDDGMDDGCSVSPSESISNAGSRRSGYQY